MTRKEAREEMARELYLQAAFFKMNTLGSTRVDQQVNRLSGARHPFNKVVGTERFFPPKEHMPPYPKGR